MKCKQTKKYFPDLLSDSLDESIKAEIQRHLGKCTSCKEEWESMSTLWAKLGSLPQEKPGGALKTRFYAMLEAYKDGLKQTESTPRVRPILDNWLERWWPRRSAYQFSLALILLIMRLLIGSLLSTTRPGNGDIAQLRSEVQSMRQMVTLSLLQQSSPSERLKGVSLSYQIEEPDTEMLSALLYTLNYDSNVNVRLAAVDALYLFHDKPIVKEGLIQSFARQSSPLVQIALIDLMVEIRERKSIEALKKLMQANKLNPTVKERAEWGIQQLS